MIKFNTRRIDFLVLAPLALVIFLILCTGIYIYVAFKNDIEHIQVEKLGQQVRTMKENLERTHQGTETSAKLFNDDYDTFYDAVNEADTFNVNEELKWTMGSAGCSGYIFTRIDGTYYSSTYPISQLDEEKLAEATMFTMNKGVVSSTGEFIKGNICDYTSVYVKDNDGNSLGVVFLISFSSDSEQGVKALRNQVGSDCFIFNREECIVATEESRDPSSIQMDSVISTSCYARLKPWIGRSSMLGDEAYICAVPLVGTSGKAVGCIVIHSDSSTTDEILRSIGIIVPSIIIFFVILFFVIAHRIFQRVTDPIGHIVEAVNRIAKGDISQPVIINNSCAEVEKLATQLNEAQNKIRQALVPVHDTADALMNASDQLSRASESLSNAANRQAASLEEISSSMEQMGANIQQNTDNSVHTNKLTEEVNNMAAKLGKASSNSFQAIQAIANNISDINDLVSQTNILALNASVEAARAGEHGQGFGVVAKEVGRLAEQTHETADGINETATSSINEAEEAFNQTQLLMPRIEKITNLIKEITTASVEQSSGVSQVNTAILDLNRVTQQNAAGAEEIAASTMQMRDMIAELNKAVAAFKL